MRKLGTVWVTTISGEKLQLLYGGKEVEIIGRVGKEAFTLTLQIGTETGLLITVEQLERT